jgi:hypothetical protein
MSDWPTSQGLAGAFVFVTMLAIVAMLVYAAGAAWGTW